MSDAPLESNNESSRFGELWHNRDFLKLWAGETISMTGSQVTTLALPLTAVVLLKATSFQVGLLNTALTVPFLFLTLFAGVWIEHKRRRPVLIATNLGRALLLGCIPMLALTGWLRIEYLYVIALLVGCCTVFFYLAYQVFLPTLLPTKQLVEGNSKLSASESITEVVGPGIAGQLIQLMTAPIAIAVDAFSFLIAAGSLALMHTHESVEPASPTTLRRVFPDIGEGFRITFTNKYLRAFAGEAATYNMFWQMILTIFLLYAVRELHFSAGTIGFLFAVGSVGALLGALLTGRIARWVGVGPTIVATAILSDIALLILPFIGRSTPQAGFFLALAFFVQGIGLTGCNIHVDSIRQAIIPRSLQGRANASYRLLVSGALPLGSLLGGTLGAWLGLQLTLVVSALGLLSTALWIIFSPIPGLRALPDIPEIAET